MLGLFVVVLVGLLSLFDWHNKVYSLELADIRATGGARTAFNNMSDYIAQGTLVQAYRTVNGTTYTTDSDTLVLEMPALGSDGNFIASTYDYVVYNLSNGSLYEITDFASNSVRDHVGTKLLADQVQSLTFTYDTGDPTQAKNVSIDLQVKVTSRGTSSVTAHLADTILLRNHEIF